MIQYEDIAKKFEYLIAATDDYEELMELKRLLKEIQL